MKAWELYHKIWHSDYLKGRMDLDWLLEADSGSRTLRVLFQPTHSLLDWAVNSLAVIPCPALPLFYALGWYLVFRCNRKKILDAVLAVLMENNCYGRDGKLRWRVVVAGHSYGGAVAVICGVYLRRMLGIRPDLVTFGAPKTLVLLAGKTLARGCFRRVFQYAHRSDLVPRMPPLPGFWHVKRVPLGTFSLKGLFRLQEYHYESYFRQETFAGHEEDDV